MLPDKGQGASGGWVALIQLIRFKGGDAKLATVCTRPTRLAQEAEGYRRIVSFQRSIQAPVFPVASVPTVLLMATIRRAKTKTATVKMEIAGCAFCPRTQSGIFVVRIGRLHSLDCDVYNLGRNESALCEGAYRTLTFLRILRAGAYGP